MDGHEVIAQEALLVLPDHVGLQHLLAALRALRTDTMNDTAAVTR